jgi:hypothetical protein
MTKAKEDIGRAMKRIAGIDAVLTGTVDAVDEAEGVCDVSPSDGGAQILSVSLRPVGDGNKTGLFGLPTVGTACLVAMADANSGFLLFAEQYDSIVIRSDELGGLVKVEALVGRLNAIEDKLNEVLNAVKSHTHTPVPPNGTAPPSLGLASLAPVANTDRSQIENESVKHG